MNFFLGEISIMSMLESLIRGFVKMTNYNTFKQNTPEWMANRRHTIGSSELQEATGTEKQKEKIIERKLGLAQDVSHIKAIMWGNVVEQTTLRVTSLLLGQNIYNINGSIVNKKTKDANGRPINSDSPDGLGGVLIPTSIWHMAQPIDVRQLSIFGNTRFSRSAKKEEYKMIVTSLLSGESEYFDTEEELLTFPPYVVPTVNDQELELVAHYEFKSPVSRTLKKGEMSDNYLFQKLSGLDTIDICNVGIFSEIRFDVVYRFSGIRVIVEDHCRTKQKHAVYFAMTLYTKLKPPRTSDQRARPYSPIEDYNPLEGLSSSTDFDVLCGPFMYDVGSGMTFCNNNFQETFGYAMPFEPPKTIPEFNKCCETFRDTADLHTYSYLEVHSLEINLVRKVIGFVTNLQGPCVELLKEVERRRETK